MVVVAVSCLHAVAVKACSWQPKDRCALHHKITRVRSPSMPVSPPCVFLGSNAPLQRQAHRQGGQPSIWRLQAADPDPRGTIRNKLSRRRWCKTTPPPHTNLHLHNSCAGSDEADLLNVSLRSFYGQWSTGGHGACMAAAVLHRSSSSRMIGRVVVTLLGNL